MPRSQRRQFLRCLIGFLPFLRQTEAGTAPEVNTFSILALDPASGELGVAVQSKVSAVGAVVPWAQAGIGAIATQAAANVQFGPLGLVLLREHLTPTRCLEVLLREDDLRENRQIAVIAATGETAAFTGAECLAHAGHRSRQNYSVQGNLLTGPEVIEAMAQAFESSKGELSDRLIAALRAGQAAGGDRRGMQSAALLVVREGWGYNGQSDRYLDLRVDDHAEPIEELARVLEKHRAMFPRPETP
jgi:uncharacterized Ntn-hydrolase superfamily protein